MADLDFLQKLYREYKEYREGRRTHSTSLAWGKTKEGQLWYVVIASYLKDDITLEAFTKALSRPYAYRYGVPLYMTFSRRELHLNGEVTIVPQSADILQWAAENELDVRRGRNHRRPNSHPQPAPMLTCLVTGGAGFIGSHVARRLAQAGQRVIVLDNFNDYYDPAIKHANARRLSELPGVTVLEGDIRDRPLVDSLFRAYRIRRVAHLAALAGVRASAAQVGLYMEVNTIGSMHLFEAARCHRVDQFVFASTSSVYGKTEMLPFVETDTADRPLAAYPASKRAAELLAHTYHHLHGLNMTVLRFFNVYGPAGRPDMMPMKLMHAAIDGTPVTVFNNGDIHRDWTYIDDTVEGVLAALERPLGYEVINLGCGSPISLRGFIDLIETYSGRTIHTIAAPAPPTEPPITFCDNAKARRLLGFAPAVDVREGLRRMWDWFTASPTS